MTRWLRGELGRSRDRNALDPLVEGARYQLDRELLLAIWKIACEATHDHDGQHDPERALRRFHELAARVAARGGRLHPDAGRLTRVDVELGGAAVRDELTLPTPGRDTLVAVQTRRALAAQDAYAEPPPRVLELAGAADVARTSAPPRALTNPVTRDRARPPRRFDDFRALSLHETLRAALAGDGKPLLAADLGVAGLTLSRTASTLPWSAAVQVRTPASAALWRAADRRAATLYRRAVDAGEVEHEGPVVAAALERCGAGEPLPPHVQRTMEARLGVALDRVRIHTDRVAAEAAEAMRADAFTVGEDIFFAHGAFAPDSEPGQRLLAHELTHVVQAWQGRTDATARVSRPEDTLEREAEAVADRIGRGEPAPIVSTAHPAAPISGPQPSPVATPLATAASAPSPAAAPAAVPPTRSPVLRRAAAGGQASRGKKPAIRGGAQRPPGKSAERRMQGTSSEFAARARAAGGDAAANLGHGLAEVAARPPGHAAKTRAHDEHHKSKTVARDAHTLAHQAHRGHEHDEHPGAHAADGKPATLDPHSPIVFKAISDWSTYMPQPLPDQDERERKRIEGLVKHKIAAERAQAKQALETLRAAHLRHAAELRASKPKLVVQVAAAQRAALAQVAAAESSQCAAVRSHVASVQSQVRGHAAAMKAQVTGAHATTIAKITATHAAAQQKLTDQKTKTLAHVDVACSVAQITLQIDFLNLQASFTDLGLKKASDAIAVGNDEANKMSGRWDGDKLDAAQKAAHDTADGFATSMPAQAAQSYQQIADQQSDAEQSLLDLAHTTRTNINTSADSAQRSIDATRDGSQHAADAALSAALAQIDQACTSTVAALAAQGASQVAAIRRHGQTTRASVLKAGAAAQASVGHTCEQAASGIEGGVIGLIRGARQIEAPNPDETRAQVQIGAKNLEQGADGAGKGVSQTATGSARSLSQQATSAAAAMTQIANAANATATRLGSGATQQMTNSARASSQGLVEIAAAHKASTDTTVNTAVAGFTTQATALDTSYQGVAKDRQTQFHTNLTNCKQQLDATVPDRGGAGGGRGSGKQDDGGDKSGGSGPKDEAGAIEAAAQKAADAVKPWWQKALAVVVSVVVAVVVVMVVTALIATTGPVGAILVGALAGALSSAAGTMASNLVLGNGLFDGITLKSIAMGAVGGAIGAGLTEALSAGAEALASSGNALGRGATMVKAAMSEGEGAAAGAKQTLGQSALKTGIGVTNDFVTNQATSLIFDHKLDLSVQNLVVSLATNGVMSSAKVAKFQADVQAQIKSRVPFHLEVPKLQIEVGPKPSASSGAAHASGEPAAPSAGHGTQPAPGAGPAPAASRTGEPAGSVARPGGDPGASSPHPTNEPAGAKPQGGADPAARPTKPAASTKSKPEPGPPRGDQPIASHGDQSGAPRGEPSGKPTTEDSAKAPAQAKADDASKPRTDESSKRTDESSKRTDESSRPRGDDLAKAAQGGDPTKPPHGNEPTGAPHADDPAQVPDAKADPAKPGSDPKAPHGDDAHPPAHTSEPSHAGHGEAPADASAGSDPHPAGASAETPSALDAPLSELGYEQATPAKRDQLAGEIERGGAPTRDTMRDTEANQQGLRDLERIQNDPNLSPEQKAKLERDLATRLREQAEPTGNLPRDLQDARNGQDPAGTEPRSAEPTAPDTTAESSMPKPEYPHRNEGAPGHSQDGAPVEPGAPRELKDLASDARKLADTAGIDAEMKTQLDGLRDRIEQLDAKLANNEVNPIRAERLKAKLQEELTHFSRWIEKSDLRWVRGNEHASDEFKEWVGRQTMSDGRPLSLEQVSPGHDRWSDWQESRTNAEMSPSSPDILHRAEPRKIELLEEVLHHAQGQIPEFEKRFPYPQYELHVKDFMIRHRDLFGLSDADVAALQQMMREQMASGKDVEGNPLVLPESANLPPRGDKPGDGFLEHSLADLVTLMKSEFDATPPSGHPNPNNAPP